MKSESENSEIYGFSKCTLSSTVSRTSEVRMAVCFDDIVPVESRIAPSLSLGNSLFSTKILRKRSRHPTHTRFNGKIRYDDSMPILTYEFSLLNARLGQIKLTRSLADCTNGRAYATAFRLSVSLSSSSSVTWSIVAKQCVLEQHLLLTSTGSRIHWYQNELPWLLFRGR